MFCDYNDNNFYQRSLAINLFCKFHLFQGLTLASKPCSATHSYPIYEEEIKLKLGLFYVKNVKCCQQQRKRLKKNHLF